MAARSTRRAFLQTAGAAGLGVCLLTRSSRAQSRSPNDRLNVACVGIGGQGGVSVGACGGENIVALCDVDERSAGKASRVPKAKFYKDWRRMFDEMGSRIDAVTCGTPDHMHAPVCLAAMKLGKHVYVEKPLAHNVRECRLMAETARAMKVVTQLGNQHHSEYHTHRAVELIRAGLIGKITAVYVAPGLATGPHGLPDQKPGLLKESGRPADSPPVPPGLDWDLWLGVAPERPYHPTYHPKGWRGWRDFGTGGYGDHACHQMDLPFLALGLKHPVRVEAAGRPVPYERAPEGIFRFRFPPRGDAPPVDLYWCSPVPAEWVEGEKGTVLFVGTEGKMLCKVGKAQEEPVLLPKARYAGATLPESKVPLNYKRHHQDWLDCIKKGGQPGSNFPDFAGYLGEAARLGAVAFWAGGAIDWDGPAMKVTNNAGADQYLGREYRKGWEL
jgi:predicted dehydrogenase